MNSNYSAFAYISGNSIIHKCPAWIKILFIPFLSILFFYLPPVFSVVLIFVQFTIAFLLKFSFSQQIKDLKPIIYYAILLLFSKIIVLIATSSLVLQIKAFFQTSHSFYEICSLILTNETFIMLLKLFCILQSTSILFKTSTSIQIRRGFEKIEKTIRKILHLKQKNTISGALAMFLNFIPIVSKIWGELKISWKARMGRGGLKMYWTLLPVFFSVGMKKAWNSARAVQIRS